MKTKHNNILIMMAVILILVAGTIIAGIFFSGRVSAGNTVPTCTLCGNNDNMAFDNSTKTEHTYK